MAEPPHSLMGEWSRVGLFRSWLQAGQLHFLQRALHHAVARKAVPIECDAPGLAVRRNDDRGLMALAHGLDQIRRRHFIKIEWHGVL